MVSSFTNQSSLFSSDVSLHFTLYTSHIRRPFFPSYHATGIQESKKHHFAKGDAFFQKAALTWQNEQEILEVGGLLAVTKLHVRVDSCGWIGGDVHGGIWGFEKILLDVTYIYCSSRWSKQNTIQMEDADFFHVSCTLMDGS